MRGKGKKLLVAAGHYVLPLIFVFREVMNMAIADAYATAAQYRASIDKSDVAEDTEILEDLATISRYIEGKLGRFFNKDAADVTRNYFVPVTSRFLWVDDLSADPTTVAIDDDADGTCEETITDYQLHPLNADKEPEAKPFTRLYLPPWHTRGAFYKGQLVEVTGKFGWPAVPAPITRACIHLTAILRLETPRATRRIPELGDAIEASNDAQNIIRQLTDVYQKVQYA